MPQSWDLQRDPSPPVHQLDRALLCHLVLAQDEAAAILHMMVEQRLRRVSSMSHGIGRESIGAAHAHTSATSSWSRSLRGLTRTI